MVWYIASLNFETTTRKFRELEKIALDGDTIQLELSLGHDDSSRALFVEGRNSSFLRHYEDYFIDFIYYGVVAEERDESGPNYDFSIRVVSTDADMKKKVIETSRNYLKENRITFTEENN